MSWRQKFQGLATALPNWRAHFLREPAPRDRYLTPAEADRVLAAAAPHLQPAIELSLLTGIRLGNCITLDWSQVDIHACELRLRLKSKLPGGNRSAGPSRRHRRARRRRTRLFFVRQIKSHDQTPFQGA